MKPFEDDSLRQFITNFEEDPEDELEIEHMIMDLEIPSESNSSEVSSSNSYFMTSNGEIEGLLAVTLLNDSSVRHAVTKTTDFIFLAGEKYRSSYFQGIVIDSGAAARSSAGWPQFQALPKIQGVQLDTTKAGTARIIFGDGELKYSMGLLM
ncbi:hypothetical protein K3495_g9529 [Podosphaera aphanis]|nr:hypothetical protein K3495_g9529 [Podosphaera aphanis]